MSKTRKLALCFLVAFAVAIAAASPSMWRAGSLWWMRSKAWRWVDRLPPDLRASLDRTPTLITLPAPQAVDQLDDTATIGDYIVHFPPAILRDDTAKFVRLTYPGYMVVLFPPRSTIELDSAAREMQFSSFCEERLAILHARPNDLDAQKDLASLKKVLLLLYEKAAAIDRVEEFERPDMNGFIFWRANGGNHSAADIVLPANRAGCPIWFIDEGRLTLDGVHHYLASLRFEHR